MPLECMKTLGWLPILKVKLKTQEPQQDSLIRNHVSNLFLTLVHLTLDKVGEDPSFYLES